MAKKLLQKKMEEVTFEIDKDAFKGPFTCHGKTVLASKKMIVGKNSFEYKVWQCPKCEQEYVDEIQSEKLEQIWTIEKLLKDKMLTMNRALNFDGKMFFLRFPKELTKNWNKSYSAEIKIFDNKKFLVEVKE